MANLKNYLTEENPVIAVDPPMSASTSTTTPYNRYEQALVSLSNQLKAILTLISAGTLGNQIHFGTAVSGTEGNIEVTVADSKEHDVYWNTSSFNVYKAVAANTWNYIGKVKGADGTPGTDGDDGIGISSATVNSSGHLILTLTDTNTIDAGAVKGADGAGSGWDTSTDTASTSCSYELAHGKYKYFSNSAISSLTITSSLANVGDICRVEFTSPSTATTYTKPTGCRHFGDDCDSSADFTPAANTPYSLTYELCGNGLKCYVKSL